MPWLYVGPRIWHGQNSVEPLFTHISPNDQVSIVTDPRVKKSEFFKRLVERLTTIHNSVQVFDDVNATPDLPTIRACARFLSRTAPMWVIGIGGGSVLDAAKAAHLLYENPELKLDLGEGIVLHSATQRHSQRSILVTIPTTTGTGSEVTCGMMVSNPKLNEVCLVASHEALAHYAVLDPEATVSLSKRILAWTAMDALGQSIEAYTSTLKNDFSDGHALQSTKLIFEWLKRAYLKSGDLQARHKLQNAACLSGLAFGNAPGGLAHALAEAFCPLFNFHHGRAVGIVLPYAMEFNFADRDCRSMYAEIAHYLGVEGTESKKARTLISKVRRLAQEVGIPSSMRQAGISRPRWKSAMGHMVHRTLEDGILKNRRSFDCTDAERILWGVWNGQHTFF